LTQYSLTYYLTGTHCAEAQRLLFAQGVATSELCHEQESQQHQVDNLTSQVGALQNIRDGLTSDVRRLEEALSFSEQKIEFKEREAEYLLQSSEEWNSKVRVQIRDLRGAIADAYSHITRLTAATGANNASTAMSSPIKPATQGAGDDTSSASLLSQVHVEMETALRMLVSAMETASQEAMTRKVALDTAEASLQEQQEQLRRELDNSAVLEEQLVKDGEQLESAQQLQHQLAKLTHEHTQYKVMLSELNRNKIELSAEYDASQAMIADLRKALTEAERLCQDYRQQHSDLLQEHDGLSTHLHLLQQQSVAAVARADEQEAAAEKSRREVTALRAEMEEMVRLQKTLESELSRTMSAPPTPHGATHHHGLEDSAATSSGDNADVDAEGEVEADPTQVLSNFDSERLLGAMYSTSDQLVLASFAVDEDAALHLRKLQAMSRAALEVNSGATMQGRYEAAIRFMGELRLWSRNEKKAKRVLVTKLTDTEKELSKVRNDVAEKGRSEKQWREAKQTGDAEIRGLERRLRELQSVYDRRHNDVSKMKDSVHGWEKRYEEERNMRLHLSRQLQQMDMEANKAQLQVADDKTTIASLNSSLSAEKDRADKLEQDGARRAEEVRALKTNNSRLVHLLEVDSSRLQHDSSSSSASDGANAFVASLQERVAELEGSLSAAKTVTQQLKQGKTAEELSGASVRRELESLKGKFSQVETRYVELEHEKKRLQQELLDARAATTAAEQRASLASDRSSRAEATLESLSLSRAGTASAADDRLAPFVEANQQQIRSLQARLDETDKSRRQAEEERIALRGRLSELKSAMDTAGSEATADKVSKEALEKELEHYKQQLSAHSSSEGAAGNSAEMREMVAALLKSDAGRELKRRVREATLATREVVNIVRADAVAQDGTYFSSPDPKPSTGSGPHAQLLEGSGVRELSDSLEAMRMCIGWLRDAPRQRNALTSNNARQEATVKDLQKELGVVQRRHDTALARVQAELKAVESQMATEQSRSLALRDREASAEAENKANSQHKEQLQRSLADERARSRSLEEDVRELEVQVEELGEMLDEKTRQHAAADEELKKLESFVRNEDSAAASSGVVRGVRRVRNDSHDHGSASDELVTAQQELRALSHHRDALSSTLEKMEDKIKLLSSSASAAAAAAAAHGIQQQHSGDGHPQQREARLRSRLDALEGLLGVYKNGIKGLYGSSSAYAYAQYAASRSGYGFAEAEDPLQGGPLGSWSGWGRLELGTLKSSFDAEIKAVDSEVIELRGKVRQSQAFSSELSKRFQGLLSESYARSGGAHQDEGRSETLLHLEGSMSEALEEAAKLRTALHDEKEQARRRHRQLIDVLNGTVAEKEALEAALKALELSGVVVPTIVRRGDFRSSSNSSSSHSQYASHHHTIHNNSNNSFSFQSPVKTYRSSPAPPHVQMPQMPPSPPAATATAAAEPAGAGQGGSSSTNSYRLRTKGAGGRGGLRVRRAGGD
jgi:chromosome segregation ATPase